MRKPKMAPQGSGGTQGTTMPKSKAGAAKPNSARSQDRPETAYKDRALRRFNLHLHRRSKMLTVF
jgi:hypothetical protein